MNYRHTQIGTLMIAALTAAIVLVAAASSRSNMSALEQSAVITILVITVALFNSLTAEVKDGELRVWFGPGLIRRSISLDEIATARAVRNPWYAGWGIRWIPGSYWLWNVSGFDAVEVEFKNGKRFRIGTDEPDSLVQAIQNTRQAA